MNTLQKYLPLGIAILAATMLVGKFFGSTSVKVNGLDLYAFGQLPVQHGGRLQPIDSVARNSLMVISGKQEYVEVLSDKTEVTHKATEWLLDVWAQAEKADKYRIFRIEHPQILNELRLDRRPGSYRYSWDEVSPSEKYIVSKADQASRKEKEQRTLYDVKILELAQHYKLYRDLKYRVIPGMLPIEDPNGKWTAFSDIIEASANKLLPDASDVAAQQVATELAKDPKGFILGLAQKFGLNLAEFERMPDAEKQELFLRIRSAEIRQRAMLLVRDKMYDTLPETYPAAAQMERIFAAYRGADATSFDAAVQKYSELVSAGVPASKQSGVRAEARMNAFDPFLQCAALYIGVAVLAALSWLVWEKPLNRAALLLGCITLVVHTAALATRMYIGNRPPVTNLYSSAIFIGWGGLALCLTVEGIYRVGVGSFVAGLIGFITMLIARFLSESGDTLEMLQAVLDTNLWLATHVTIVTLGYVATFVAGLIAIVYIVRGMFTQSLRGEMGKKIGGMMYGVLCFATLLSFTGTVLGGIWADQSWGRFWGWDPKENGAVLIVIWNSLILHARWGGLIKARGLAVLAVLGNMVTAWSWFGTNQLGIGLHAYGFDNRLAQGCMLFWISQGLIAMLGMVPLQFWASFGPATPVKGKAA